MAETEGTIQFAYDLVPTEDELLEPAAFAELAAWRDILKRLDLLGHFPDRYGGFAYGNISAKQNDGFVITASQTSGAETLLAEDLVRVTHCNLQRFWIDAEGQQPPSSESLTHAMIYVADPRINFVFHVHNTAMWQHRSALGLPETAPDVPYGSPQMVAAVSQLLEQHQSRPLVFATAGHEDGVFALAHSARDCGGLLVTYLAKAHALEGLASA